MHLTPTPLISTLLLTLLLGLLSTLPASAAPAGTFAGTIKFMDPEGVSPVTHVSLNGPASTVGIQLRIVDKDLDVIIKREGVNADALDSNRQSSGQVQPLEGETWFDLQDMNGDDRVNNKDIRALDSAGTNVVQGSDIIRYDRTNGTLSVPVNTAKLEYWIKKKTTLGSGSAAQQSGRERQGTTKVEPNSLTDGPNGPDDRNGATIPVPEGHSLLPTDYGWIDVLEAQFPGLKARQDIVVALMLAASIRAYNETPASQEEPDLVVEAFFTPAGTNGQPPASVSFKIFDAASIGEPGEPGFQPGAEVGVGPDSPPSNVVVEYEYWGSPESAYPERASLPSNATPQETGRVTVSSDAVPKGISIVLKETHAASGVFVTAIVICEAGSADCAVAQAEDVTIPVNKDGDSILVAYEDDSPSKVREATLLLDVHGPTLALFSPTSGDGGREDEPTVSFQVTDAESGLSGVDVDKDSIYLVAGLYDLEAERAVDSVVFERDELDLRSVIDGYSASVSIDEGRGDNDELNSRQLTDDSQYEIRWWAVASDQAGNVGVSDSDYETECVIASGDVDNFKFSAELTQGQADTLIDALEKTIEFETGCDPHVIRVDTTAPSLEKAVTGSWLDDDTEKEGPDAIRTSIVAVFNEALDCATVTADDFNVGETAPNSVTCKGSRVYLAVDDLVSDATPNVEVAKGAVSDRAGNPVEAGSVTAEDSIPAKLAVIVTGTGDGGTRAITKRAVTITISSDERLSSNPMVTINKVSDDYSLVRSSQGEAFATSTVNRWINTAALSRDGLYAVRVSAVDQGGRIEAVAGLDETDFNSASLKNSKAILFEVDNELQAPTFTPEDGGKTDNPNLFIRIDFKYEAVEYGLAKETENEIPPPSKTRKTTDDPAMVDVSFDTNSTVELVSTTFDDVDVTGDVITRDNLLFYYHHGNLNLGDHKLKLEAKDSAGNWWTDTLNFTVIARQPYKLPIYPGVNLVSLPAEPIDGDVNAVFGGVPDIVTVVTYDNPTGQWMIATRGEDGTFTGDLMSVDANHGYWVISDGAFDLEVMLLKGSELTIFPPAVEVVTGWNLVPVVDTAQRAAGTSVNVADYFANIDANVAFGYDSTLNQQTRLSLASDAESVLAVGSAYWVYANEPGVIIP